ncbi:MAG: PCRF domain-containing protein, partial [Patescibacteria group bacterium]|nr:PCRF domain-containing protein [Patescibacteria group bacterium]
MEYNSNIVTISVLAGAGGDDAKDWAQMLLRMYRRYADLKKWKIEIINDATIEISARGGSAFGGHGEGVYEKLKNEYGVHRLVRVSPFDAKGLRHTSFALVEVLPDLPSL